MNLANLSQADRVKLLKGAVIFQTTCLAINMYAFHKTYQDFRKLAKRHNRNVRKMKVAAKIIERLMKEADPDLLHEIVEKYEFDWIVAEIDPDEIEPKD